MNYITCTTRGYELQFETKLDRYHVRLLRYLCNETGTLTIPLLAMCAASRTMATGVSKKTVLVLNYGYAGMPSSQWRPALLINSSGRQEQLACFSHEDNTEAYMSCSLLWNNEFYVYGGQEHRRQISKLNQYRLKLVGALKFDFYIGACTNMADRKLFLCFDLSDSKRCYWSTNPLGDFQSAQLAFYNHAATRISSSDCEFLILSQG